MVSNWLAEDRLQYEAEEEIRVRALLEKLRKERLKKLEKELPLT